MRTTHYTYMFYVISHSTVDSYSDIQTDLRYPTPMTPMTLLHEHMSKPCTYSSPDIIQNILLNASPVASGSPCQRREPSMLNIRLDPSRFSAGNLYCPKRDSQVAVVHWESEQTRGTLINDGDDVVEISIWSNSRCENFKETRLREITMSRGSGVQEARTVLSIEGLSTFGG
jgi:hypothetical protein